MYQKIDACKKQAVEQSDLEDCGEPGFEEERGCEKSVGRGASRGKPGDGAA